jgi:hypothetical protein
MALGNGLSLEDLGNEARDENSQIHKLTKQSTQDAAAVKVLTIIMLVYLPATVVSVSQCQLYSGTKIPDGQQELLFDLFCGQKQLDWLSDEAHCPVQLVDLCSHLCPPYLRYALHLVVLQRPSGGWDLPTVVEKACRTKANTKAKKGPPYRRRKEHRTF